ncbi:PLD nuclease N-terminal domain-containing protein [Micromonosporaceae bacterium Da 78-11]
MARFYMLILLLDLALLVVALIDCLSADEPAVRTLPRTAWVFVILLCSPIGAIGWFLAGRPATTVVLYRQGEWRPVSDPHPVQRRRPAPRRAPVAPIAPDDDEEFLRGLDKLIKERQGDPES